jgi:hypothetical protein
MSRTGSNPKRLGMQPLHLGFNQLAQGLLVAISIRRRIETSGPLELGPVPHGGTDGSQTRRWRGMDSNFQFPDALRPPTAQPW